MIKVGRKIALASRSIIYFEMTKSSCIQQNRPLNIKRQSAPNCRSVIRDMALWGLSLAGIHWWWCSLAQKPLLLTTQGTISSLKSMMGDSGSCSSTLQGFFSALKPPLLYNSIFVASNRKYNLYCLIHALVLVTESFKGGIGFKYV